MDNFNHTPPQYSQTAQDRNSPTIAPFLLYKLFSFITISHQFQKAIKRDLFALGQPEVHVFGTQPTAIFFYQEHDK